VATVGRTSRAHPLVGATESGRTTRRQSPMLEASRPSSNGPARLVVIRDTLPPDDDSLSDAEREFLDYLVEMALGGGSGGQ